MTCGPGGPETTGGPFMFTACVVLTTLFLFKLLKMRFLVFQKNCFEQMKMSLLVFIYTLDMHHG